MRLALLLALIPATWLVALALVPWASRRDIWGLATILTVGCSGSLLALVLA
jgi:hypothetical protein